MSGRASCYFADYGKAGDGILGWSVEETQTSWENVLTDDEVSTLHV